MGGTPSIDLQQAALRGNLKEIKQFTDDIDKGGMAIDINQRDDDVGYTCLTEAIKSMHIYGEKKKMLKLYDFIINEKGADVNQLLKTDESPLHLAAYIGRFDIASMLLANGAKADVPDKAGYTPIHWACLGGHVDIVNLILEHDVKEGEVKGQHIDLTRRVGGLLPYDLCRLRLGREEHGEGMFSYEPDDWTKREKEHSDFFKICEMIKGLEESQRMRTLEAKREARRIKWPGDPLYDKKMRKKVYCTRCKQGYRSVSRTMGICPECRENDAEKERIELESRMKEIQLEQKSERKRLAKLRKWEHMKEKQAELYPELTADEQLYVLWDAVLRICQYEAEECGFGDEARYFKTFLLLDEDNYISRCENRFECNLKKPEKLQF
mgnify:CR=1 FL=1|jgi:hypothetical protein